MHLNWEVRKGKGRGNREEEMGRGDREGNGEKGMERGGNGIWGTGLGGRGEREWREGDMKKVRKEQREG